MCATAAAAAPWRFHDSTGQCEAYSSSRILRLVAGNAARAAIHRDNRPFAPGLRRVGLLEPLSGLAHHVAFRTTPLHRRKLPLHGWLFHPERHVDIGISAQEPTGI